MHRMRRVFGSLLALGACAGARNAPSARVEAERPNLVAQDVNHRADALHRVDTPEGGGTSLEELPVDRVDAGDVGQHPGPGEHVAQPSMASQPVWLDDAPANLAGCEYARSDSWREKPTRCTCIASDGSLAPNCPRMTPHSGFGGCLWTGVATHFRTGSRRIDATGFECVCTGKDDNAAWDCHRPAKVRPL
jgi:hypothetical protein